MLKILLVSFLFISQAYAKKIMIIHTNDLHSFFEGTRDKKGGYSRIKNLIDDLRTKAKDQGMPTLVLDAGDFGEGSSFFFNNEGVDSLRALDLLGIDATVIGNHDYLLGKDFMLSQLKNARVNLKVLGANIENKKGLGFQNFIKDSYDFSLDDLTVRVIGVTTNELHYRYALRPEAEVSSPIKKVKELESKEADLNIALTHIGPAEDIKLAKKTSYIGLIVGGHSHEKFEKPLFIKNLKNRRVPIVQAGAHGAYVGTITLELSKNLPPKVLERKLYPITSSLKADLSMDLFIEEAKLKRNEFFDSRFNEVIGFSEIPLSGDTNGVMGSGNTCWSNHIAKMSREVTGADIGIQVENFQGEKIEAGKITYGDIIDNFPHTEKLNEKGWRIATTKVNGILLKSILTILSKTSFRNSFAISGLGFPVGLASQTLMPETVDYALIHGEAIAQAKSYTLAFPNEVAYALGQYSEELLRILMPNLVKTNHFMWPSLEDYVRRNSPIRCL